MFKIYGKHSIKEAANNKNRMIKTFVGPEYIYMKLGLNCKFKFNNTIKDPYLITEEIVVNSTIQDIENCKGIIILDNIINIGNIGAIIRTAGILKFGVLLKNCATINEKIVEIACGGCDNIPIIILKNTAKSIQDIKQNYLLIALHENGEPINNIIPKTTKHLKPCIIVGSEENGISDLLIKNSDYLVKLHTDNSTYTTYNASVAIGISMYLFSNS